MCDTSSHDGERQIYSKLYPNLLLFSFFFFFAEEVGTLHSLYCMTFHDLGRHAVAASVAMTMCSPIFHTSRFLDAPVDDVSKFVDCIETQIVPLVIFFN